ncbi:MAG TPA: protein kinase [Pyrinomonadaceae bacterium]|nr:protein kinase [Pyrinomonadaceae bacterium]
MNPERWHRITSLFEAALLRPDAAGRRAFLAAACGGDEELRREVEAMLASHEEAPDFLEEPAAAFASLPGDGASLSGRAVAHYQVLSRLGSGGMGDVYLALDTRLGRRVALKFLPDYLAGDERRARMFTREARAASALSHPNIITVYELGESDGRYFIAMEYVEGETLGRRMHRERDPLPKLLDYLRQAAEGLQKAHAAGVVHRDLKPDNIMVTRDGFAKVLDFGLAKQVGPPGRAGDGSEAATAVLAPESLPGMVMGTAGYMSPEQAQGRVREIDHRSDIFSFGCILYEAATGRKAFEGADVPESLNKIIRETPAPVTELNPDAPAELERIVRRCLHKDPERRYQSIKDVAIELEEIGQELKGQAEARPPSPPASADGARVTGAAGGTSTTGAASAPDTVARPTSSAEYVVAGIKRHGKWVALAAVALVAALGVAALLLSGRVRDGREQAAGQPPFSLESIRLTRLTTTGRTSDAAVSPDGKYVAYNSIERLPGERAGAATASIWIRQVATGRTIKIVPAGEFILRGMTFSPDGDYLYYRAVENRPDALAGQVTWLSRVSVIGGDSQRLLKNLFSAVSFSPDGKRIAFVRNHSPVVGDSTVVVANADGTGERIVSTRGGGELFANPTRPTAPAWSPDGRRVACALGRLNGAMSLLEIEADGSGERQIGSHRWSHIDAIAWLPDGAGLMMTARDQSSPQAQIWHVSYPEGSARRVTNDLNEYQGMSLSVDGRTMVVAQSARETDLWVMPGDGRGEARRVTTGVGKADGNWGVSWTADGKLVYGSNASGSRDLWLLDPETGAQKQLTADARQNYYPAVTPDGRSILFLSDRGDEFGLWRVDIDGGNPTQVLAANIVRFTISPDGQWVVYSSTGPRGVPALWRARIDGSEPALLNDEYWEEIPSFSPDGRQVAFQYFLLGAGGLSFGRVAVEGGPVTKIGEPPFRVNTTMRWTPDGRALAYIDNRGDAGQLFALPAGGGPPKQLTDFKSDYLYWFDWSRDGRQLAVARGTTVSDAVLVTNLR